MIGLLWLAVGIVLGTMILKRFKRRPPTARPSPEELEARQLLGVGAAADSATIRAAHRRLVQTAHPDTGGSAELTRRINAARDVLLKR